MGQVFILIFTYANNRERLAWDTTLLYSTGITTLSVDMRFDRITGVPLLMPSKLASQLVTEPMVTRASAYCGRASYNFSNVPHTGLLFKSNLANAVKRDCKKILVHTFTSSNL